MQKEFIDFIQQHSFETGITGASFTIQCPTYHNGKEITYNAGHQSKNGKPVTNKSLYQIGSLSKSFLVVVVLQLEEEGLLNLEDKVAQFFPHDFKKWQDISIKKLLNMTSKIPSFTDGNDSDVILELIADPILNYSSQDILNLVKDKELNNLNWEYSNTNYVLAGKIIEKVTGNKLSTEIQSRILIPLHLKSTYYIKSIPKIDIMFHDLENLMSGYFYELEGSEKKFNGLDIINLSMSRLKAAGSLISNSSDINFFIRTLFESKNFLSRKQQKKLITMIDQATGDELKSTSIPENSLAYGLGIEAKHHPKFKTLVYGHTGGTFGFQSAMWYIPDKKLSYYFALNTSHEEAYNKLELLVEEYIVQRFF
ncbi:serine hydrolase domain-containing protein [Silvanigrella aquatica]|uniref:Beta-lactamase-related domain-containing protein n=1 Tax=Silvanigrella aquatica TaxID=1915309 RepID=A0A1L4CYA4_9BACT|nr:serine hydrolase domain-containing protein [Silvanigrella aquatica]APJ02928.1 hypothetical protein AXG55_02945 [Silvanigrella aquatica]